MTENDVTRALKYWESEGLLRLSFDRDGSIAVSASIPFHQTPGRLPLQLILSISLYQLSPISPAAVRTAI
ncbi:MAG: hypothetical protein ACLS2X_03770 [Coprococcus sp.]